MTRVGRVDPGWGVGCPAVESSQFCTGHAGSTGSTRVCRVDPVRRIIPGRAGQPGSGGLTRPQSGMNQPLVHPGSAWVDPGRAGDPGWVGLSRSPGHPGFGLVYPGLVGLSRGGRVNPGCRVNPGLLGSSRVGRVIPSCSGEPGLAGSSRVGRVIPAQSGMTQPLVHPGSAWVDPGRAGDPGWVGLSRSPGHPGFGLVYPGSVGLSRASVCMQ